MQLFQSIKLKLFQTYHVTSNFLALSLAKHQSEPFLIQTFNTCSDILNVVIESLYTRPDKLFIRKAGTSYYSIPLQLKDKHYIYLLPYKPSINKIKQVYEGHYDEEQNWVRDQEITSKIQQYAGPNENFFNTPVTPEILGYNELEFVLFESSRMELQSLFFKKIETINI